MVNSYSQYSAGQKTSARRLPIGRFRGRGELLTRHFLATGRFLQQGNWVTLLQVFGPFTTQMYQGCWEPWTQWSENLDTPIYMLRHIMIHTHVGRYIHNTYIYI